MLGNILGMFVLFTTCKNYYQCLVVASRHLEIRRCEVFLTAELWHPGQSVCLIMISVDCSVRHPHFTVSKTTYRALPNLHMWLAFFPSVYPQTSLSSPLSNTSWGWCTCLLRQQDCVIFQWGVWSCCSGPIKATDETNLNYRCIFLHLKCLNMHPCLHAAGDSSICMLNKLF